MLLKPIILFAIGASSFTIPENHPEGTYMVKRDANGKYIHTLIQARDDYPRDLSASEAPITKKATLRFKRNPGLTGINEVTCNGVAFPKTPADAAYAALKAACPAGGSFWAGEESVYSYVNGGVAYWCNIDPFGRNGCYGGEVTDAIVNRISGLCGGYQSGWLKNAGRNVVIGYGTQENNFCLSQILVATSG